MFQFLRILLSNPLLKWIKFVYNYIKISISNSGRNLKIENMTFIANTKFGCWNTVYEFAKVVNVSLGDFTYIGPRSRVTNATIGKFCCIGPDVTIGLGKHPSKFFVSSHPAFFSTEMQGGFTFVHKSIYQEISNCYIGNDVWVGAQATIMDGVVIGDGAIIGTAAVVTKDVSPYTIVAGVPATVIRMRFSHEEIKFLQELKWWNKDIEWIKAHADKFNNIENLIQFLK
jgi:acetyltransferase-like isoleucine patch superfamily enzyme